MSGTKGMPLQDCQCSHMQALTYLVSDTESWKKELLMATNPFSFDQQTALLSKELGVMPQENQKVLLGKEEVKEDKNTSKKHRKSSSFFGKVKRASSFNFIVLFFAIH